MGGVADMFRLDGKTAIVFGIGPAIGRKIALILAEAGANVVVNARNAAAVEQLVLDINAGRRNAAAGLAADLSMAEGADAVLDEAQSRFGGVDVVVYNAYALDSGHGATFSYTSPFDTTEDDWAQCFQVNVMAPYRIAKRAVPRMQDRGGAFIHCIAAAAETPILPAIAYGSTKAALATMTKYLAKACAPKVRFNSISPSNVQNPNRPPNMSQAALDYPMARLGLTEEAAAAALYLASPASGFTTGEVIHVDGGRTTTR